MSFKNFDAAKLANQHITGLKPYKAGMTIEELARRNNISKDQIIKLASNENPYGMSRQAEEAIKINFAAVREYPDNHELISAISNYLEVSPENIIPGSGTTEVLDFIARVFLSQYDEAISSKYGFIMPSIVTKAAGAKNIIIEAVNYGHDLGGFLRAINDKTKVIWISNPNNPTGSFIPYSDIKIFLEKVPENIIVVLDEAYYEYLPPEERAESQKWIEAHPNLILTRTFSKIHGLAGLRAGYGIAHKNIIDLLNRVRQPCNVTNLASAAAVASLKDSKHVMDAFLKNLEGLKQLKQGLDQLKLEYLPSQGNFLAVWFENAALVHEALLKKGIIVRPLTGYEMPDYLRISVGKPEQNEALLSNLNDILSKA